MYVTTRTTAASIHLHGILFLSLSLSLLLLFRVLITLKRERKRERKYTMYIIKSLVCKTLEMSRLSV